MKSVCLVTGAGSRLGTALCRELSCEHNIIATYRRTKPEIASQLRWPVDPDTANVIEDLPGPSTYCVQADLNQREDVRRLVEVSLARYGKVDAIVNVAGDVQVRGKLLELWHDDDDFTSELQTNCFAPLRLVSAIHYYCWKDQCGENAERNRCVVNVSCLSGLYVYRDSRTAFHGASKASLNMLTMYLSLELAPYSVRANAICPGRATDEPALDRIVRAVKELLLGAATGTIVALE
jgi:NAD(P)-dependent dehydrogenase (short-subunit alcohol dehydrogenase family)